MDIQINPKPVKRVIESVTLTLTAQEAQDLYKYTGYLSTVNIDNVVRNWTLSQRLSLLVGQIYDGLHGEV